MQKNYRFSKEARKYSFDYRRGADLKVKFDSSKKYPTYGGVRCLWMTVKNPLLFSMLTFQQKVQFQAGSGRFFGRNPLKCGQICLKF